MRRNRPGWRFAAGQHLAESTVFAKGRCGANLYWCKHADLTGKPVDWHQALEMVAHWAQKKERGKLCWRLPTINALASLVDCATWLPALPAGHPFTGVQASYWTATTSFFETDWAWVLYLDKGACGVGHKPGKTFRCGF